MSITKSIIAYGLPPSLHIKAASSQTRITLSSSKFASVKHDQDQSLFSTNSRRVQKENRRRFFMCDAVQPGAPSPSEPPFNFLKWIVGVTLTVVLPFFSHKWVSLLKLKNEVDSAVETIEEIVEAVEKAADGVEKAAEDLADDLPEGGRLRKAVDFFENVAERASEDAHLVGEFIDRVQEAEEKVEACVDEALHEHTKHPKDRAHHEQQLEVEKEANDDDDDDQRHNKI